MSMQRTFKHLFSQYRIWEERLRPPNLTIMDIESIR